MILRSKLLTCAATLAACLYIFCASMEFALPRSPEPKQPRPSSPSPPPLPPLPPPLPTASPPPPAVLPRLLSAGRPAKASVRGNLASASAVTSASTRDWLKDRWQAASDMNGTPIPGEHWVSIDLGGPHLAVSFVLDWETACADDYAVQALRGGAWVTLPTVLDARTKSTQHVVDTLSVRVGRPALEAQQFRVLIRRPATRWGVSLWRFEIWGSRTVHSER
jgi:hypothetical protein